MTHQNQKERIAFLSAEIKRHRDLYTAGKAEISDESFDRMEDELRALDKDNASLRAVGGEVSSFRSRVSHIVPMLSLDKTYSLEDLKSWIGNKAVVGLVKLDGSSVSLVYVNGKLSLAKTRGNGTEGEDITKKLMAMAEKSIVPGKIVKGPLKGKSFEVRGEIFCESSNFGLLSDGMVSLGLDKPSSVRNIVSGLLARKDHDQLTGHLSFSGFSLLFSDSSDEKETETKTLEALHESGFRPPIYKKLDSEKSVDEFLFVVKGLMEEGEIPLDGAVFSINEKSVQKLLGETSHHPRYKM